MWNHHIGSGVVNVAMCATNGCWGLEWVSAMYVGLENLQGVEVYLQQIYSV